MSNPSNDVPTGDAGAGTGATGAPAGAAASAFSGAVDTPTPAPGEQAAPPAPLHERIPEKFRVAKEGGEFDLEASTAKLLDGHAALEKRLGAGDVPPKDAEGYDPKVEGFDMAQLKQDPDYQSFLKGAHAKGMTNAQVEYVLSAYAGSAAIANLGGAPLSAEEFKAEMTANHWKGEGEYDQSMAAAMKAIRAYAPDITKEEIDTLPNHPIVAKILAAVGKETAEDRAVRVAPMAAADFDSQLAALQAHPAYMDAGHAEHATITQKVSDLFAKRYPTPTT